MNVFNLGGQTGLSQVIGWEVCDLSWLLARSLRRTLLSSPGLGAQFRLYQGGVRWKDPLISYWGSWSVVPCCPERPGWILPWHFTICFHLFCSYMYVFLKIRFMCLSVLPASMYVTDSCLLLAKEA